MSFLVYLLCGVLGGVLGGMGMGGGTVLIPLVLGVPQRTAQGVNLLSFLPMSLLALAVHAKGGLLDRRGLIALIVPALLCSVLSSLAAAYLPAGMLRQGFGLFLCGLAVLIFHKSRASAHGRPTDRPRNIYNK